MTLVPLAVLLAIAVPASAEDCEPTTTTTDEDTIVIDTMSNDTMVRYVVVDLCQLEGCLFSVWAYPESNGREGLQRNDEFSGEDACGNGDTWLP